METVTLKVCKETNTGALKTVIISNLAEGKTVFIDTIGVAANYIATKATIMVRDQLTTKGQALKVEQIFTVQAIESEPEIKRTGIRWILSVA